MIKIRATRGLTSIIALVGLGLTACVPVENSSISAKPTEPTPHALLPSRVDFTPPTDGTWPAFMSERPFSDPGEKLVAGRVALNQPVPFVFTLPSEKEWSILVKEPPVFVVGTKDVQVTTHILVTLVANGGSSWEVSRNVAVYFFPGNYQPMEGQSVTSIPSPTTLTCPRDVLYAGESTTCAVSINVRKATTIPNFFWWVGQPGGAGGVSAWAAAWPGQTV